MTSSHSSDFVFFGRDDPAHPIDEDLGAAARHGVETRVAKSRQRLGDGQLRAARDVLDLRRREGVEVDLVARLDRAEQILVVVDPEIGVVAALHQEPRAADRECLLDLLVDHGLRQEVALAYVARSPVEGAEVAVGDADVRVVEISIDDERDLRRVVEPVADLVGDPADRHEVARTQECDCVLVRYPLAVERPFEHVIDGGRGRRGAACLALRPCRRGRHAATSSRTKRSSGTWGSCPASRAISRNVYRPARSRGPKLNRSFSK